MKDGFPLLTTKKMPFKIIATELIWFLRGDTNIKYLVDNNCHIWDGDAYKNYLKSPLPTVLDSNTNLLYQNVDKGWCVLAGLSFMSPHPTRHLTQEEFINKIKIDDEFAKKWGELGPIYGKQWRRWESIDKDNFLNTDNMEDPLFGGRGVFYQSEKTDQIQNLINDLKTNPDSRRLIVNSWNVSELEEMVLPPCHYGFQMYTRELSGSERAGIYWSKKGIKDPMLPALKTDIENSNIPTRAISLMWNQRSVDTALGLPFNIASYAILLSLIAKIVNMVPDQLIGTLGDVHLYSNHLDGAKEQIGREFSEDEILEHLQQSGMDALRNEPRLEYISKLPKRTREPFPLPTLSFSNLVDIDIMKYVNVNTPRLDMLFSRLKSSDFIIEGYESHPAIKFPLSN